MRPLRTAACIDKSPTCGITVLKSFRIHPQTRYRSNVFLTRPTDGYQHTCAFARLPAECQHTCIPPTICWAGNCRAMVFSPSVESASAPGWSHAISASRMDWLHDAWTCKSLRERRCAKVFPRGLFDGGVIFEPRPDLRLSNAMRNRRERFSNRRATHIAYHRGACRFFSGLRAKRGRTA